MGSLFGGGGGGGQGAGTSSTPSNIQAQIYQPQAQPTADVNYQSMLQGMYNPAFAGLPSQNPATTAYQQAQTPIQALQYQGGTPGTFGFYGQQAQDAAQGAWQNYANYYYGPAINAAALGQQASTNQIPTLQNAADNPLWNTALQNIASNQYGPQQLAEMQAANVYGLAAMQELGLAPQQLAQQAQMLPQQAQSAADLSRSYIDPLNQLAGGIGQTGQALSAGAQGLIPQLQQLQQQLSPQLAGAAAGYANQAQALQPQLAQLYGQLVPSLQQGAQGYSQQAGQYQPYLNQLIAGGAVPASQQLAQQGADIGGASAQQLGGLAGQLVPGLAQGAQTLSQQAQAYQPWIDQLTQQGVAGSQGLAQAGAAAAQSPQLQALSNQLVGGLAGAAPQYAQMAQQDQPLVNQATGAAMAGSQALAQQAASRAPGYADQLQQAYAPLQDASNRLLQTGFDPQQALYNRTAQNLLSQQNAINALSGVGTSPYGAGVTGQTMENFNIDWQNQQLQRQAQAAGAAGQLTGMLPGFQSQALGGLQQAQGMQAAPANLAAQQAQQNLAATQAGGNLLNALSQGAGGLAQGLSAQQMANLGQAQGMAAQPLNLGLAGAQQGLAGTQAQAGILNALSQGAGGLAGSLSGQQLSNLATGQGMQAQPANLGLALAQQGLAGTQAGANILNQLTQGAGNLGTGITAQQLSGLTQGGNLLNQLSQGASNIASGLSGQQLAALTGAGSLYNAGALGQAGLYGQAAGLGNTALNQLLAGAQGMGNAYTQGTNLGSALTSLQGQAANLPYNAAQQQQANTLNALSAVLGGQTQGAAGLGQLGQNLGQAAQQELGAVQALSQLGQQPAAISTQQAQNALQGLTQGANLGASQFQLPQQVMNDLQSYLQLGQAASGYSGQLGALGFNQGQQQLGNIGSLLSGLGGSNLLFGSGGLSGALGLGQTGLLGGLLGGATAPAAADLAAGTALDWTAAVPFFV